MATRIDNIRDQQETLGKDKHFELKKANGDVFKPNIFIDIEDNKMSKIWVENNGEVLIPDEALLALKKRLTWMTGTA